MSGSEAKLCVPVPEDVRKYRAPIAFGLTIRQIFSGILAGAVCVPLYYYGRRVIPTSILSWVVIFVACGLFAFGFVRINNMPFEKFLLAYLESLLAPQKRLFKSFNVWRLNENRVKREREPKGIIERYARESRAYQASLERTVLIMEAEERGESNFNAGQAELLTVRMSGGGKRPGGKKDGIIKLITDKIKAAKERSAKRNGEVVAAIRNKQRDDPSYMLSKSEFEAVKRYNNIQHNARKRDIQKKKVTVKKKDTIIKRGKTAKTTLPRSTQQTIPYEAACDEGVFEVVCGQYSKLYIIKDVNYGTSREDERNRIFSKYCEVLNYFGEDITFQMVIDNRIVSLIEQENTILSKLRDDGFDRHREESNRIIRRQMAAGRNDIQCAKLLAVTIDCETAVEAIYRFHRIDNEVNELFLRIGSGAKPMTTGDRLAYYHDKFRSGHEADFRPDFAKLYEQLTETGVTTKDYIAPSLFKFSAKDFQISFDRDDFYRVFYLTNLPKTLTDDVLKNLSTQDFPVTISLNTRPIAQDATIKMVRRQKTNIETNKMEAEKRAQRSGYSPDSIRQDIKDAHESMERLYDYVTNKDQKMFYVTITLMVHGSTPEELERNCETLAGVVRTYMAQLGVLNSQQEEGMKITLPFGYRPRRVVVDRTLTTEAFAAFIPFSNQELLQSGGFYYGLNRKSNNLVVINRTSMKTPSGFVLGSSGSGKSFATKREMLNVLLNDAKTGVLVIDPENEYGDFCRAFGGTVIKISADSDNYINPLDMTIDYGLDENDDAEMPMDEKKRKALTKKSNYIMSIVERMMSAGEDTTALRPQHKTIIDECVRECFSVFLDNDCNPAFQPTLMDLQAALDKRVSTDTGRELAESVAYYTRGSNDVFSHRTNVAIDQRFVVFNVRDLGDQLRQIALTVMFDFIWNRMIENKNKGVRTYCYCDEIHVMFRSDSSAEFLKQLYKRGRKYGLCITGLTQNVSDLLVSEQAKGMIGNSDYIMMLNQNSEDMNELARMLNISDVERAYVTGADPGSGLIFAENTIVPFYDKFPSDSYLYALMSTKFGEDMTREQVDAKIRAIMGASQ